MMLKRFHFLAEFMIKPKSLEVKRKQKKNKPKKKTGINNF